MNPPNLPMGKPYSFLMNKERPLSRQNPLKVNKESRKITKNSPLPKPLNTIKQIEEPRIIYTVPQRVIHVTPHNFKDVVQSLTGIEQPTGVTEVLPAARLTSPEKKERPYWSNGDDDMMRMLDNGVQMSQFPGLLLPEPAVLPPLPYENFLPPELPQMQYNNFLPPELPQMQYNNFLPPRLPQRQYNNFQSPRLPQMQYNNFLPATLPQIQYNNSLPAPLPPVTTESLMQQLTTSEMFPPVNNVLLPPEAFLPDTWKEKPSDIFSPATMPQSDIFSPIPLPLEYLSPETLLATQSDNLLPDNWQPSDILLKDTCQPSDTFSPERLPSIQSDNLLPDNWHPSDILSSDTYQPSDTFSPVTLPSTRSDNFSPDNWSPSDILSEDTWSPSDILSQVTLPSTQSDTFSADPWQSIDSDIFSPIPLPPTPSDTCLSADTFSPETSLPKPHELFSPVLGQHSQTLLPYKDVWPENNVLPRPPEFIPADVVPPRSRSNQFSSFNYH